MKCVLRSKRTFVNDKVQDVWEHITDYVTEAEANEAVEAAAAETLTVLEGRPDQAVYGWSGGKDSIALEVVMQRAGVRRCLMGSIPHLEFRTFMAWCEEHQPDHLVHLPNNDVDLRWLADPRNDRYLFPANYTDGYKWTVLGTRRAQFLYQEQHHPAMQIYGRRTIDGNIIPSTPYGIHRTRKLTTYSPIRHWPHELVLAVIHYNGKKLPPVYSWPHGWRTGNSSWPGRRLGTRDESFAATYGVEPDLIREAASVVPAAADWMQRTHRT